MDFRMNKDLKVGSDKIRAWGFNVGRNITQPQHTEPHPIDMSQMTQLDEAKFDVVENTAVEVLETPEDEPVADAKTLLYQIISQQEEA